MVALERVVDRPHFESSSRGREARDLDREFLLGQINKSARILIREQHDISHLFPAAASEKSVEKDHYHHSWVRDGAMIKHALLDPIFGKVGDPNLVREGRKAAVNGIKSSLSLFANEPWSSGFGQKIEETKDAYGRDCTRLTQDAPPIHFMIDGKNCPWPTQNQPDSWGILLTVIDQAVRQNILTLTEEEKEVVTKISNFLGRARIGTLQQFSMWEWGIVYEPPPTSTLALCSRGLELAIPIVLENQKEANRRAASTLRKAVERQYPEEYTVTNGHESKSDMATLVAAHMGALDGLSLYRFFRIAHPELGNGQYPGKRRFRGDHYYRVDEEEAIWPMGALLEANIFLGKALFLRKNDSSSKLAERFARLGLKSLQKVQDLTEKCGYIPELLQIKKEGLSPNDNHLLWNEALMLQASSRAFALV
ncbi:MAG: hypothetical protein HYT07_00550 [Candidatus Levybacteria bacterium]|nr:hypothetical protein [Candidatus Levybacteria bacterium]